MYGGHSSSCGHLPPEQITCVSLLFAVYPGFRELSIATVFNVHLVCLMLTFFSFGGMLWALRHPKWFWPAIILSLLASIISTYTMEYFITLEVLRPVFIWMILRSEAGNRKYPIKKTILLSLPYFLNLIFYGLWRIFIFKFPYYVPVLIDPSQSIMDRITNLIPQIINSIFAAGFLAWINPFIPDSYDLLGKAMLILYWFIFITVTTATLFLFQLGKRSGVEKPGNSLRAPLWSVQAILIGVLSLFLAGWPLWIAGLQVDLEPLGSRFTLPFIFGSCLLLNGVDRPDPR